MGTELVTGVDMVELYMTMVITKVITDLVYTIIDSPTMELVREIGNINRCILK